VVQHNRSHGQPDLRLFEIGNVFHVKKEGSSDDLSGYDEEDRILILATGSFLPIQFGTEHRKVDLLDIRGEAEAFLSKFCLDKYRFISYDSVSALIESALAVEINGSYAGFLGKVSKSIAQRFDIDDEIFVCELKLHVLEKGWITEKKLTPLPRFPSVRRDLAFVVDQSTEQESVARTIKEVGGTLLAGLILFDVFVGDQVGAGKKSLAYSLELQPLDRTLTEREIDAEITRIVSSVESMCHAKLRAL